MPVSYQHSGRKAGKTRAQLDALRHIAHPDDLERLKLDLIIYGMCVTDETGRRKDPSRVVVDEVHPLSDPAVLSGFGIGTTTAWRMELGGDGGGR